MCGNKEQHMTCYNSVLGNVPRKCVQYVRAYVQANGTAAWGAKLDGKHQIKIKKKRVKSI